MNRTTGLLAPTVNVFTLLARFLERLGTCAIAGVIAGALAGLLLTLLDAIHDGLVLSLEEVVYVSLLLAAFTSTVVLFVLISLARLTFRSVALPTILNCLVTCALLVFICRALDAYTFAWILGLAIGTLVGRVLCFLYALFKGGDRYPK